MAGKSLDDVFDALKDLIDLSRVSLGLHEATLALMSGGEFKADLPKGVPHFDLPKSEKSGAKDPDPFSAKRAIYKIGKAAGAGRRSAKRITGESPDRTLSERVGSILGALFGGAAGALAGPAGAVGGAAAGYVAGGAVAGAAKRKRRGGGAKGATKGAGRASRSLGESLGSLFGTLFGAARGVADVGYKAVARAGKGRLGRFAKAGRGIGKFAGAALGKAFGSSAKGAKETAGVGGAIGGVVGGVAAIGVGFTKATQAVMSWTDEAFASSKRLAEVSSSMALVHAQRDINQMFRDMDRGERTSGTASALQDSESELKDALQPIVVLLDNIWNTILKTMIDLIIPPIELIVEVIKFIYEALREVVKIISLGLVVLPPFGGAPVVGGGLGEAAKADTDRADAVTAAALRLMAAARAAAVGGVAAPVGAMPPFRL